MPNLHQKRLHSSPSVMVSFHGLFNAAQMWHKCIYTASVIMLWYYGYFWCIYSGFYVFTAKQQEKMPQISLISY